MNFRYQKNQTLQLELNITELESQQTRLIRTINSYLMHVLTTEDESEFFEGSSELLKMAAIAIKQSNYMKNRGDEEIKHAEQAIEYSVESLFEHMAKSKLVSLDN